MKRIFNAIEEKLKAQEEEIYWQKYEVEELKRKLVKAEATIAEQAKVITDLKGANA